MKTIRNREDLVRVSERDEDRDREEREQNHIIRILKSALSWTAQLYKPLLLKRIFFLHKPLHAQFCLR